MHPSGTLSSPIKLRVKSSRFSGCVPGRGSAHTALASGCVSESSSSSVESAGFSLDAIAPRVVSLRRNSTRGDCGVERRSSACLSEDLSVRWQGITDPRVYVSYKRIRCEYGMHFIETTMDRYRSCESQLGAILSVSGSSQLKGVMLTVYETATSRCPRSIPYTLTSCITCHPFGSSAGPRIGSLSLYDCRRAVEGASGRIEGVYPMSVDILPGREDHDMLKMC